MGQGFSLDNRVALVTGSTGGIGRAIAEAFSEAGARVAVNGRDAESTAQVAATMKGAIAAPFDITDYAAAAAAFGKVVAETGRFDILVCCAASRDRRPFGEIEPAEFRRVLETNAVSTFELSRIAATRITDPECGRLIFISSTGAKRPFRGDPIYASSKAGMESLVRSLAYELGPTGTTANAIAPGFTATDFNMAWAKDGEIAEFVQSRVPARRWGRPEEIANVAVFLASDASSYVNGHVLTVDGGLSVIL